MYVLQSGHSFTTMMLIAAVGIPSSTMRLTLSFRDVSIQVIYTEMTQLQLKFSRICSTFLSPQISGPGGQALDIDFSQALLNTWIGEIGSLYDTGYTSLGKFVDDDSFHVWQFDWHTDPADRRVEFYLDDQHLRTMRNSNIPFYASRLWIGEMFCSICHS